MKTPVSGTTVYVKFSRFESFVCQSVCLSVCFSLYFLSVCGDTRKKETPQTETDIFTRPPTEDVSGPTTSCGSVTPKEPSRGPNGLVSGEVRW